jgi:hypothetical protein
MRRTILLLAFALLAITGAPAVAASPVTGSISCTAEGTMPFSPPYLPEELAQPNTRSMGVRVATGTSTCDDSAVVGAKGAITRVDMRLNGRLGADTSCADFFDTVALTGKVKIRWQSTRLTGRPFTIAKSKATVASTTYDSGTESFVIVTDPISNGAFAGSTVTTHFKIANAAEFADHCMTHAFRYGVFIFEGDHPITIDVP